MLILLNSKKKNQNYHDYDKILYKNQHETISLLPQQYIILKTRIDFYKIYTAVLDFFLVHYILLHFLFKKHYLTLQDKIRN